jgi:hypothetical protein
VTVPLWNPARQYYPPVKAPPIEWLAQAFLTPLMAPTPVKTRLPQPNSDQDTLQGFLRIEAGDSTPIPSTWGAAWNCSFLMHSYSPNEVQAEDVSTNALGYVAAATGLTIVGWYVVGVPTVIGGRRLYDPLVPADIVRYRSAVTWTVAGKPPTITTQ